MKKKINRLLAMVVAVSVIATYLGSSVFGQRTPATPEQRERRALQIKTWVEADAKAHPKWRVLICFRDGTQAAGKIREIRENDFVLEQSAGFPPRTIAYSELGVPPKRVQPMAEKIAERTGLGILFVVFFPLIVIWGISGGWE